MFEKPIAPQREIILSYDTIDAMSCNGELATVQTFDPLFLQQIPNMKFKVLGRTTE